MVALHPVAVVHGMRPGHRESVARRVRYAICVSDSAYGPAKLELGIQADGRHCPFCALHVLPPLTYPPHHHHHLLPNYPLNLANTFMVFWFLRFSLLLKEIL